MNKGSHQGCHKQVSKREIIMMRTIKHILIPIIVSLSISACDYGVDNAIAPTYDRFKEARAGLDDIVKSQGYSGDFDSIYYLSYSNGPLNLPAYSTRKIMQNSAPGTVSLSLSDDISVDNNAPSSLGSCDVSPYGCLFVHFQNTSAQPQNKVKLHYIIYEKNEEGVSGVVSDDVILNIPSLNPGEFKEITVPINQEGEWLGKPEVHSRIHISSTRSRLTEQGGADFHESLKSYLIKERGVTYTFHIDKDELNRWDDENSNAEEFITNTIEVFLPLEQTLSNLDSLEVNKFTYWLSSNRLQREYIRALYDYLALLKKTSSEEVARELRKIQLTVNLVDDVRYH